MVGWFLTFSIFFLAIHSLLIEHSLVHVLLSNYQVIPILRAGLALAEHAPSVLPATKTYHLGKERFLFLDLFRLLIL